MGRMQDKVVFITGIGRGQGRSHALRLASEGASIIGVDLCEDIATNSYPMSTAEDLKETVRLIEATGQKIVAGQADVRDLASITAVLEAGVQEFGRLDGIVANAGICPLGTPNAQAFLDALNVDFIGVVNTVQAGLPHLEDGGSIVATGSVAGLIPGATDNPDLGPGGLGYSWAKRAVASFVNDLAIVTAPQKIRVNAVHPANTNTMLLHNERMYKIFRPDIESPTREDAELGFPAFQAMPVPYLEPSDISDTVLYLLSDDSKYVTGMQMRVDAGGYVKLRPQQPTF